MASIPLGEVSRESCLVSTRMSCTPLPKAAKPVWAKQLTRLPRVKFPAAYIIMGDALSCVVSCIGLPVNGSAPVLASSITLWTKEVTSLRLGKSID